MNEEVGKEVPFDCLSLIHDRNWRLPSSSRDTRDSRERSYRGDKVNF